jgi:hypothetical protein
MGPRSGLDVLQKRDSVQACLWGVSLYSMMMVISVLPPRTRFIVLHALKGVGSCPVWTRLYIV